MEMTGSSAAGSLKLMGIGKGRTANCAERQPPLWEGTVGFKDAPVKGVELLTLQLSGQPQNARWPEFLSKMEPTEETNFFTQESLGHRQKLPVCILSTAL